MKAILKIFNTSGEILKMGEWGEVEFDPKAIAEHQIEISDLATRLNVLEYSEANKIVSGHDIPLPRAKKKVKKWVSFFRDSDGDVLISGSGMKPYLYDSKEEALENNHLCAVEIEVEED